MESTGERIKKARLAAGFTQEELADKIGVKFSAIHKYENGLIVNLKRATIANLAKALSVSPLWLMGYDDEESTEAEKTPTPALASPERGGVSEADGEVLPPDERDLLDSYRSLNDCGKEKARDYISDLRYNPKYQQGDTAVRMA